MSGDTSTRGDTLDAHTRARVFLVLCAVVTVILYVVPYGRLIGYPLMLLSTLAHEMGHGLAAVMMGASFEEFRIWSDGSGVAVWRGNVGALGRGFIAAGGLVGPAAAGALGFVLGRTVKGARASLVVFGLALALALLLVVRGWFGWIFVGATGGLCLAIALKARPWVSQVTLVFLATQLALSVFSRGDYLFTDEARTGKGVMPSDVAHMADALFLPYWFWGAVCGAASVAVLVVGLRAFWRATAGGAQPAPRR